METFYVIAFIFCTVGALYSAITENVTGTILGCAMAISNLLFLIAYTIRHI